jgi:long-chain acyl-CoA synthetase
MTTALLRALTTRRRSTAIVHGDDAWSGEALDVAADRLAGCLAAHVGRRHRIALSIGNTPDFAIGLLAAMKLDASAVLLNTSFTQPEMRVALERTKASALIVAPHATQRHPPAVAALGARSIAAPEGMSFDLYLLPDAAPAADPDELTVQFTSGVSGRSKIVPRSLANIGEELESFASALGAGPDDATICPCPLYHAYGLINGLLLPLFSGRPAILVEWFLPGQVAQIVEHHQPRIFIGVPTMYKALADASDVTPEALASLRVCFSAGAPLTEPVLTAFRARYGRPIHQQYGSTETGAIAINLLTDPNGDPLSAGTPLPGRRIRVLREDGSDADPGERGEIVVYSSATASRYLDDEAQTSVRFREGGYFTGDFGYVDDGQVRITGRRAMFINVAGRKVDAREVEEVLSKLDALAECAVVAQPDALAGEVVKAVVVARREVTANEIRQFCQSRLAAHKVPRIVTFREALPRTATGKILNRLLVDD